MHDSLFFLYTITNKKKKKKKMEPEELYYRKEISFFLKYKIL